MSSSSFASPPATPRFRSTDTAEEPLIIRRYEEFEEPYRSFLKRRAWLSHGRTVVLGALLLLGVWGVIVFSPTAMKTFGRPLRFEIPEVEIDSIRKINATILHGEGINSTRWTVEIPAGIRKPLRPSVYGGICSSAHEVGPMAQSDGEMHGHGGHSAGHTSYYWFDKLFIDPADSDEPVEVEQGKEICETSLTYLLESKRAGLGASLMGLWSAYGMAKKEGRSFFVDDRDWAWGSYSTYFLPPPAPKCAPPPAHWLLPCPHSAKHLVVTPATHSYVFGHSFVDEFEDPRKMGVLRQVKIFDLVRQGYEDLFRLGLREDDLAAVEDRKNAIKTQVVVVHIRRGDRQAMAWEYKKTGYVPLSTYVEAARNITAPNSASDKGGFIVSSDDPELYSAPELADFEPAQYQPLESGIEERGTPPLKPGFVAAEFWQLNMGQRTELGRTYLRDLKIMGELAAKRGSAVCDATSVTCRLIAVIMGWDRAIVWKRWVNVDGGFPWSGVDW